jgi:pimeloyl-ACP methyl ester carboxylesterase
VTHAPADRFSLEVAPGRSVDVLAVPDQAGLPLIFHTGTPSGLVACPPLFEAAARHGLRCVLYSRPGYGRSDAQPGRRVASAAADTAAILEHLGATDFVTAGWSGGGPHALACAALLGDRCRAAATLAGVAPYPAAGLDWLAGMDQENIDEFEAAIAGEAPLSALLSAAEALMAELSADEVADSLGGLLTAADKAVATGQFGDYLAQTLSTALAAGIAGWRDDDLAFVSDWGFDVGSIAVPVTVWQGDQDAMVPFGHGQWLISAIPGALARLLPGDGHLTLMASRIDEIIGELAAAGR